MDESILRDIKKMLGLDLDYDPYNADLIVLINSALMVLCQLGVGPKKGFIVKDYTSKWSDFLINDVNLEAAKQYIYLKVRVTFDPPNSSAVLESYNKQIQELEWRLNVQAESVETFDFMNTDARIGSGTSGRNITVIRQHVCIE